MYNIKFVYFDVGGVALLDYSGTNKWQEMKDDLGITGKHSDIFEELWDKNDSRICIDCDVDALFAELKEITGIKVSDDYSMLKDFVNRFERNHVFWDLASKVKEKYKVGLLTNMYPGMLDEIIANKLIPDLKWDSVVDSSIVGTKKPHKEMFEIAENMSGFTGNEILFIDNQQKHLDAASLHGWETMIFNPQNPEKSNTQLAEKLGLL